MTNITMRDSVNPKNLYGWRGPVAGYIDGKVSAWPSAAWSRFEAGAVRISVLANPLADVFDVEKGNVGAGPVQAAIVERSKAGLLSVVYTSRSQWTSVRADLAEVGEWVRWFIADWTGQPHLLPGSVGTQYASLAGYDESLIDTATWPRGEGLSR